MLPQTSVGAGSCCRGPDCQERPSSSSAERPPVTCAASEALSRPSRPQVIREGVRTAIRGREQRNGAPVVAVDFHQRAPLSTVNHSRGLGGALACAPPARYRFHFIPRAHPSRVLRPIPGPYLNMRAVNQSRTANARFFSSRWGSPFPRCHSNGIVSNPNTG
ncbi:hypothetical protein SKAU_G00228760 [Synaphobranchus kaupii]|uniref:Uncharacterized protein n=1 Tax=Synaphobranchus kaupii TaxID=118154 RepID=A0A9Q1IS57_SYNKA|nr:hypothetical protein SKAU_G00228760 [Synaphobranchus kaupii]